MKENNTKYEAVLSQIYRQLNNMSLTEDDKSPISIEVISTHVESTVAIFYKQDESMLISPSKGKDKFLQVVFFALTLKMPQNDVEMKKWRKSALLAIKKFVKNQKTTQSKKKENSNKNTQMSSTQLINRSPTIDDSGIVCFDDELIVNQKVLFGSRSKWTKIGYGGCGVVFQVGIKVVCFSFIYLILILLIVFVSVKRDTNILWLSKW